ncbi:two-component regulator propeller domain-containing protein [uncultured Microscilla sp.]|uniref:ligand-binding sensor domain-containing protein n=1 Tax=uncultured Microscilla sp. TaxID=432653 RepID=UPI002605F4E0|nr:sensor histidine kinase [uncultured Microscilla sp.]
MKNLCRVWMMIIGSCAFLQAQSCLQGIKFSNLTSRQGLSQNSVTCVLQDTKGLLWFGTTDGLNKFDGYRFTKYTSEPGNSQTLISNYVSCLYQDRASHLWVGMYGGGVNRMDPVTGQVTASYHYYKNKPGSLTSNKVKGLYEDKEGLIWVATYGGGVGFIDPATQKFTRVRYRKVGIDTATNFTFCIINEQDKGLWVGSNTGILYLDLHTKQFTRFYHINHPGFRQRTAKAAKTGVNQIVRDKKQPHILWLCTHNSGLVKFNTHTQQVEEWLMHDPNNPLSVNSNSVWSFYQDSAGNSWVGSRKGFHWLNPKTQNFARFLHDAQNKQSIGGNDIQQIFEDKAGTIWLCTYDGGISSFNPHLNNFDHYTALGDKNSRWVKALCEDAQGNIYAGLGKGPNAMAIVNRKKHHIKLLKHEPTDATTIASDIVTKLLPDVNGKGIWVGTIGQGLDYYDIESGKFIHYGYEPLDTTALRSPHIGALYQDKAQPDILWVGTLGMGMYRFKIQSRRSKAYMKKLRYNGTNLSHNTILDIVKDYKGNLWLATREGLNCFDPKKEIFTSYFYSFKNPKSLSNNYVSSLYVDTQDVLWVGTHQGLNRLDLRTFYKDGKAFFDRYTTQSGLPNEVIHQIIEDNQKRLWVSTNQGLSCLNPETNQWKNYDVSNGLQSNEFLTKSGIKTREGAILMGGVNGFNLFYPDKVVHNTYKPKVLITDFQIFNQPVPVTKEGILTRPIWATDTIELSYKDKVISFEFAALNYILPEKNTYHIKLENFDADWRNLGTKRFETYTNLAPGTYVLKVKAANNDGVLSDKETRLVVKVRPPFWQTTTFYVLMVVLLIALVLGIVRWRTHNLKKQKKVLEHKVTERTKEIKMQAEELQTQTEEIKAQAEELRKINEQLLELDEFKQGVTGMIVHDLKNPLNTLMAYAKSPEIKQSARQMHHMVLNILDVQKMESAELIPHWDAVQLYEMVEEAIEQIQVLSLQKNLYIQRFHDIDYQVRVDRDLTTRVLVNLLTNAIKHAPLNSSIMIEVNQATDHQVKISITDEGEGVPPELQQTIFDKFFSLSNHHISNIKSTGLGLAFCKLALETQQQTIGVTNHPSKGAQFWFTLSLVDKVVLTDQLLTEQTQQKLLLSAADKQCLQPFVSDLQAIEICEIGRLKKLADGIPHEGSPQIQQWKDLLLEATFSMNQYLFDELVSMID